MLTGFGAILLFIAILLVLGTLAYGAISAAPWVPLLNKDAKRIIALANLQPGELIYDLGCGDGRLLIEAARHYGVRAIGFELALVPYMLGKLRVALSSSRKLITIRYKNFWHINLNEADAIFCFLTPYAMKKLEPKLKQELKSGARFVTYAFKLPNLQPKIVNKPNHKDTPIYLYT